MWKNLHYNILFGSRLCVLYFYFLTRIKCWKSWNYISIAQLSTIQFVMFGFRLLVDIIYGQSWPEVISILLWLILTGLKWKAYFVNKLRQQVCLRVNPRQNWVELISTTAMNVEGKNLLR